MNRNFLLILLYLLISTGLYAQSVNRYPVIQSPTEQSAAICWRTLIPVQATLNWGDSETSLSQSIVESASSQKHELVLEGLNPGQKYFYQVINESLDTSEVEYFFAAKPNESKSFSFLHYGDCGYNNSTQNDIAEMMEAEDVDFAVVAGDVDQADGSNYDDIFFGVYKEMLANECHFTAIGNHDIIHDDGDTYLESFYMPTNNPQASERYYSFTWGHSKFICLDSNIPYNPGSDQHNFLMDELKCNDRQWLMIFFHHPPWTNAWDPLYYIPFQPYYEYDGNDDMRTDLVPYFEQYGVDFVLNGHSHCYQRGELNGVQYVISGGAGSDIIDQHTCNTLPSFNACAPNLQVEHYENHYVRFDISEDVAKYVTINRQGTVIDSLVIQKSWTDYMVSVSSISPSGSASMDGSIDLSVEGPHAPYTVSWDNGATGLQISSLDPGTYVATITNDNGCSRTQTVELGVFVSSDNAPKRNDFNLFPNPARDNIRIEWSEGSGNTVVSIQDIMGRTILKEKVERNHHLFNISSLSNGLYVVQLETGNSVTRKKFRKY